MPVSVVDVVFDAIDDQIIKREVITLIVIKIIGLAK